jgi:UDP-N-acetylmuramyl pentapeptide phosphotransferase/UDP-N-acetylglucosamine-1-phosphate transferase
MLLGSLVMFTCGLWDDVQPLRPATKLLWQFVATSLFVYAGGSFPLTHVQVFDILLTYFWFVGITNAVNLLDNMDGLASGVVMVAVATIVVLAVSADVLFRRDLWRHVAAALRLRTAALCCWRWWWYGAKPGCGDACHSL